MTPLRTQMIKAMQVRGFSARTHTSYLAAVTDLARYTHRSPAELEVSDLKTYFEYLATERHLSGASCRLFLNAIRFLYLQVLEWPGFDVEIAIPKKAQRIPELLTRREVRRILGACDNPKHQMMLALGYGCGLRVSELVAVQLSGIDSERCLLRIEQGKAKAPKTAWYRCRIRCCKSCVTTGEVIVPRPGCSPAAHRTSRSASPPLRNFLLVPRHGRALIRSAAFTACATPEHDLVAALEVDHD